MLLKAIAFVLEVLKKLFHHSGSCPWIAINCHKFCQAQLLSVNGSYCRNPATVIRPVAASYLLLSQYGAWTFNFC